MRSERVRLIVEIALCVALAAVLNLIALRLPINIAGGTISLSMVPIFIIAVRRGVRVGVVAGAIYGIVDLLIAPFVVYPLQVILDYPVAYGLLGLAGLGAIVWHAEAGRGRFGRGAIRVLPFLGLGAAGRFAAHWLSGVLFFGQNAPAGQPVWLYSLLYNLSYLLPSVALCATATLAILPVLERAVPSRPLDDVTPGSGEPE